MLNLTGLPIPRMGVAAGCQCMEKRQIIPTPDISHD
jgi:hypothetical protein